MGSMKTLTNNPAILLSPEELLVNPFFSETLKNCYTYFFERLRDYSMLPVKFLLLHTYPKGPGIYGTQYILMPRGFPIYSYRAQVCTIKLH